MAIRICIAVALLVTGAVNAQIDHQFPGGQRVRMGQVKKDPAKEIEQQRKACGRKIENARKHLADKQWGEARLALDRAWAIAVDASQASSIKSLYQKVDQQGRRKLDEARDAYKSERFIKAIESLEKVSNAFGWLPSGQSARKTLDLYKSDSRVIEAIAEAQAGEVDKLISMLIAPQAASKPKVKTKPASAPAPAGNRATLVKALPLRKQHRVMELLTRIAKSFPECPTGRRAHADLEELKSDKAFSAELAEFRRKRKAQAALSKAEMYRKAGMTTQAVGFYKDVIESYPGTAQAATAKARLSLIGDLPPE